MKTVLALLFVIISLPNHAESIEVIDFVDRTVKLSAPAKRVVALAPHIVENIYSAGAGHTIVGAVEYSDYPFAAKSIPRVGAITSFSLEAIVALKPDLVITWHSGKGANILPKLLELNIPTYASAPQTMEDVSKTLQDFGKLFGTEHTATLAAEQFSKELKHLKTLYSSSQVVSVFYEVWPDPLQTLNGSHVISDVISLCGGTNIFNDAPMIAPKVSIESVISKNPDAIVTSGMGESRPDWLDEWKKWPELNAVKHGNLFHVPPDIIQRHTVRMLQGAKLMCEHIEHARQSIAKQSLKKDY